MLPEPEAGTTGVRRFGKDAVLLRGFAREWARELVGTIDRIASTSPFRRMTTPGGRAMSVAMTNCGDLGWVTDGAGYRYSMTDPLTGDRWPTMPTTLARLAVGAASEAGFERFSPDGCLINRYEPGARLSLHQDRDEADLVHPIVSVSLGLPAIFLWGGERRSDPTHRIPLLNGDVVVWGRSDRLTFHGVAPLPRGDHEVTGCCRYNMTFRKAG